MSKSSTAAAYDDRVDYVMRLHNYCGRTRQQLTWETTSSGPADFSTEHVRAMVNGRDIGQGQAVTQFAAKKFAAFQAMNALGLL